MQSCMMLTQSRVTALKPRLTVRGPAIRPVALPRREFRVRAEAEDEAKQAADKVASSAEKAASTATETPKEVAEKVEQSLPSSNGASWQDKVDAAGKEISSFTQETSGLTKENTSINKKQDGKPAFEEAMSFSGQVPERANSRLAMLAFVAAAGAELATGSPVATQLKRSPLLIGLTFIVFIVASIIPIVRGEDPNKESGPFTVRAELWNGRLAMLGFIALLLTETFKSTAAL